MSYLNSAQWAPSEMSVKYCVECILTVEHFTAWFPCPYFSLIFYDIFHTLFVAIQLTGTCHYSPSPQVILAECPSKLIGVLFPTNWKQLDRFLLLANVSVLFLKASRELGNGAPGHWESSLWHCKVQCGRYLCLLLFLIERNFDNFRLSD